jgi:hypothetical protein
MDDAHLDETQVDAENELLPLHTSRPMCTSGDLCVVCEVAYKWLLRLEGPFRGKQQVPESSFYLGWVDRLVASKSCPLCQFIAKIFLKNPFGVNDGDIDEFRRFTCTLRNYYIYSTASGMRVDWNINVRFHTIHGKPESLNEGGLTLGSDWMPDFRLLIDSARRFMNEYDGYKEGDKISGLALPLQGRHSAAFMKHAYSMCTQEHGERCNASVEVLPEEFAHCLYQLRHPHDEGQPSAFPSRLFDVVDRKIVPRSRNCEYTALSYCWPADTVNRYLTLSLSNEQSLQEPNGVDLAQLIPAVADAVEVLKSIAKRYLWVDCLCIAQDDPTKKMLEIAAMDTIYRNAELTIIAAAPVDAGLPGIRSARPAYQHFGYVRDLTFVTGVPDLQIALSLSKWNSRAWTYQESTLSKRKLIFTSYQGFYVCHSDILAESYLDNHCMHREMLSEPEICCAYEMPDAIQFDLTYEPVTYSSLVNELSRRQMTYDSDALNVGAGLLNMLKHKIGMPFICGLPAISLFETYMFWLPCESLQRRDRGSNIDTFPSWSWISWKGRILYTVVEAKNKGRSIVLHCHVLIRCGHAEKQDVVVNRIAYRRVPLLCTDFGHGANESISMAVLDENRVQGPSCWTRGLY